MFFSKKSKSDGFLSDFVYGAVDGTVTTFAVVSGVLGASLSPVIVLVLGFANLFADGFSMAVSNYLATESRRDLEILNNKVQKIRHPFKSALVTFLSFIVVGFIPIAPFVCNAVVPGFLLHPFGISIALTGLAFIIIGAIKAKVTKKSIFYSALETLIVGGLASLIAFVVGYLLRGIAT